MGKRLIWIWLAMTVAATGAERRFDFGAMPLDQTPTNFLSAVSGRGKPGDWKLILDDVAPLLAPLSPQAPAVTKRTVLAQTARDATDDHYPMLILKDEEFGDFTLTTQFKIVDGAAEQMAGLAFRIQDPKNYYYVRASALGNNFLFFKFVNGDLIGPIGVKVPIGKGVWHEMTVECHGSQITCSLDGKVLIPQMQQDNFPRGKIGFWTKSDSVSYFADTRINYRPLEASAQVIVRELSRKYSRLEGLQIYVSGSEPGTTRLLASKDPAEVGRAGDKAKSEVIRTGETYYGKDRDTVSITMPLRDRNGDVMAAARVVMKTFKGQTEENAIVRAAPIVKEIQNRVHSMADLAE